MKFTWWKSIRSIGSRGPVSELLHPPASQIPFLDFLRAVAVLLVIHGHISNIFVKIYGVNLYSRLATAGGATGIDLFFVLSGFFIGGQLWKEWKGKGSIAVGRFLLRRGMRIWPLYYSVFIAVFIFGLTFEHFTPAHQYGWSDLIFITNYRNHGIVEGSWSLCTEEQFYLIAPITLFFLARRIRSLSSCRPWLWGLMLFIPLLRAAVWIGLTGSFFAHRTDVFPILNFCSITHCDGLIMGLLIANYWVAQDKPRAKVFSPGFLIAASLVMCTILHAVQKEIFSFTYAALVSGAFVWLGLQKRLPLFHLRIFYWLSRLSYGMYLNHEYFCPWVVREVISHFPLTPHFQVLAKLICFVILTPISVAIALVTFCCIEYPFLELRKKILERSPARVFHSLAAAGSNQQEATVQASTSGSDL